MSEIPKCKMCERPIGLKNKLIEEFLPHLDWALNELYYSHYNNEKYKIHYNYYIKLKERRKQMAYMNDDMPYDEYIKKREKGRAGISQARFYNKSLTSYITFIVTPKIRKKIDKLIQNEIFPNKSEFLRYLIIKFFEEHPEWFK